MFHNIYSRYFSSRILTLFVALVALIGVGAFSRAVATPPSDSLAQIEPDAGTWQTWVLESGDQLRLDAPPDEAATAEEIVQLIEMAGERDEEALQQIAYWNAGPPSYRWNQIAMDALLARAMPVPTAYRDLSLLNVAIYDATIAAWDSKYAYERLRPSEIEPSLITVIPNPLSPSYPSEYAVTAGAASTILAWLFPEDAQRFQDLAQEAINSRLLAGVEYPSDVEAGLALGQQVAELVIERGEADGTNAEWTGSVPTEPGHWTGENPAFPTAGTWQTWVLESGDQFRPDAPPAYDSEQEAAEMEELLSFERTPVTNSLAMFWEFGAGGRRGYWYWNDVASRLILEAHLDENPPLAARAYTLINVTGFDAFIACWDAKYAYWAMRPVQVDPEFTALFSTPPHPAYPSGHSTLSTAAALVLGYLFPADAEWVMAAAEEAGESRIWAGIHFRSDIVVGNALGEDVGNAVIAHAMSDGSQ
jgi:membrane-associated phospholipid phosphatase